MNRVEKKHRDTWEGVWVKRFTFSITVNLHARCSSAPFFSSLAVSFATIKSLVLNTLIKNLSHLHLAAYSSVSITTSRLPGLKSSLFALFRFFAKKKPRLFANSQVMSGTRIISPSEVKKAIKWNYARVFCSVLFVCVNAFFRFNILRFSRAW